PAKRHYRFAVFDDRAGELRSDPASDQKPGSDSGVETAGDQQDRAAADESNCGRFARRYGDAMHLDPSEAPQSLHSRVVPPAAGAPDGNDGIVRLPFD